MGSKEIGSEFWEVPVTGKNNTVFNDDMDWYISGRSALQAIIKDIRIQADVRSVSLPSWCCHTMIKPFIDEGIEVHFYPVYWRDSLIQEISLDSDVLFLMDYFGYTESTPDLSDYNGVVIRDITHSLLSHSYTDAAYYFGSLRKWCGVWTGGYAWANDGHRLDIGVADESGYVFLREQAMNQKNRYINGWPDKGKMPDKSYMGLFEKAEECLEECGISPAADRDVYLAMHLDVEGIRERRRKNAEVLMRELSDYLIFREVNNDCPMFVPILVPYGRRDKLRRYLIQNKIYCPIHWSVSEYHQLDERMEEVYLSELSLVCDQRYTQDDMERQATHIKLFLRE